MNRKFTNKGNLLYTVTVVNLKFVQKINIH
jgi:hypothetical protein